MVMRVRVFLWATSTCSLCKRPLKLQTQWSSRSHGVSKQTSKRLGKRGKIIISSPISFYWLWKEPSHPTLDAEGRILLPKHRCPLLFESFAVSQICVWDGRYDLGGHMIPVILQEIPDLSKVAGEHERYPSKEIPPHLIDGWAEVLGPGPTVTERQNFWGALGVGRAFSSHFKKTPLVGLKKLQLARA